jgi:hypothetical protein
MSTIIQCSATHTTRRVGDASLDISPPSTCHHSMLSPVMKLALRDDGNLALIHRSILRSINDSIPNQIPNQIPTARNFPALSLTRPEHHPSCHPFILLSCTAIIEKSHNPPATLDRIVENETKNQYPKNPRQRKELTAPPQRAAALRCGGHICTNHKW